MRLFKSATIAFLPLFFCFSSFAQDFRKNPGYRFSKEDISDFLLYQSKKDKTKGIVTLVVGSVLTGTGIYLSNNGAEVSSSGGRVIYPSSIGKAIGTAGLVTTFLSIPLFMSASKKKKEARLVFADQSTSFLNNKIAVPSAGVRLRF